MAMSRSRAETSLTTRSPIWIVPDVGVSNPAIIRSAVVLPHPEDPTRIMNSPSAMSSDSSSTATAPPAKRLVTASSVTPAMSAPPSLDPRECAGADEPPLGEQEHGQHRDLAHHGAGHEQVPLGEVRALQLGEPELERGVGLGVDDDQRPEEVIPGPHELDDPQRGQRRQRQRQDDLEQDAQARGAVHAGGLLELDGQRAEELAQ